MAKKVGRPKGSKKKSPCVIRNGKCAKRKR